MLIFVYSYATNFTLDSAFCFLQTIIRDFITLYNAVFKLNVHR
jgi:hypothetical protein